MPKITVVPERLLDPSKPCHMAGYGPFEKGGKYLDGGLDITGWTVSDCLIGASRHGRPSLFVYQQPTHPCERTRGRYRVRTNLFRRSAGWEWVPGSFGPLESGEQLNGVDALVSIEYRGEHHYTLAAYFDSLLLDRLPHARSEPRLRPTTYARWFTSGVRVGDIRVRGKQHPVYNVMRFLSGYEV
jgi:hypothetical protein